jgi:dTDP-glucose 4,6-dehydratase
MEKVMVIGSNSFSGAHFADYLLDNTKYNVIGISRSPEKSELYLPYKKNKELSRFEFQQLDLNKNLADIMKLIDNEQTPYIVNFASQSMVGESWQNPEHWYKTNVLSMVEFTNELRTRDFLKNFVHISTPEVYGSMDGRVKEDHLFNPSSPYASSRAACDMWLNLILKQYKFPVTFTRAANVYGPGQQLFKILPRAAIYMKQDKKIPLHGGGFARRSFIHIKDVCEGTLHVMEKAKPGEVYHLSTDDLISVKDVVAKISELQGKKYEDVVEVVGTRPGLDLAYILDSSKAKQDFDWQATTPLDKGLNELINWVDDNWDQISKEPLEYIHQE